MSDETNLLDGTVLEYTYDDLGTVVVTFNDKQLSFEWIAGPFTGEAGSDFAYRAREVGDQQFFINWHEPDTRGFVALYADLNKGVVHSAVLAAYATDDEQTLFDSATIRRIERV